MDTQDIISRNFTKMSDEYRQFFESKDKCRKCCLFDAYKTVSKSEGNALDPIFMVVGEAYGKDENNQNRPFIGRSGQRLRRELRKYPNVFNKDTTIITNVLGCRPKDNKFPEDKVIVSNCFTMWLYKEIEILKPKIIITLGGQSLLAITGNTEITKKRGEWNFSEKFNAWVMSTYHPSYVIRCEPDKNRAFIPCQFDNDIKKVAEEWEDKIGLGTRTETL